MTENIFDRSLTRILESVKLIESSVSKASFNEIKEEVTKIRDIMALERGNEAFDKNNLYGEFFGGKG